MQEKHVTVAGKRYDLPAPFHVLGTQNPLEQEGTYPLPEAQLDRFLLQIDVGYPDETAERQIMIGTTGSTTAVASPTLTPADLMSAQALVRRLPIGESVVDAIVKLVRAGRPESSDLDVVKQRVAWGPGPRASQAFMLAARARAIIQGRLAPSVDDVVALGGSHPASSHGGQLLGPRRGHHGRDGDQSDVRKVGVARACWFCVHPLPARSAGRCPRSGRRGHELRYWCS
jgi:MoxR-like ATPase